MALFGRENEQERRRAEAIGRWARARSPLALAGVLFGLVSVLDAFTIVLGGSLGAAAVVCGMLGLRDIARRGCLGRRLCLTAIALGAAGMAMSLTLWWQWSA